MSEDPHHLWEPVGLQYIQELKRLYLKPKTGINQQYLHETGKKLTFHKVFLRLHCLNKCKDRPKPIFNP